MALTIFSEITPLPERSSGTKPDADGELWNTRYTEVNLNFELLEGGSAGEFWKNGGGWAVPAGSGVTNGHIVEDEGTPLTQRSNLDFIGGGVSAADGAGATEVTIPSSAEEIAAASEKTTPVDADKIGIFDSAAAGVLKWLSWANVKTALAGSGGGSGDGWIDLSADTWTYASATAVTITGDATDRYSVGDPVRYKQGGAYKYGYIVDIAFSTNTTLTIYGGSDYSIANAAITDNDISKSTNPVGHPFWFNWDGSPANITVGNGTLTSQFAVIGKEVVVVVEFNLGTTSSISGNVSFASPLTIGTSTTGVVYVEEGGVGGYVGVTLATGSLIYVNILSTGGTYGSYLPFSSTVPFTWGATDSFKFILSYPLG